MKRVLLPLVLVAALVLPAQAAAKTRHYTGTALPAGTIGFKVTQKKGTKRKTVRGFNFNAIPVTCADGVHTTHGVVNFGVRLRKGFTIKATSTATGATLEVQGRVNRTAASGTIRVAGNVPIETGVLGNACDSGVLSWTAVRG